MMDLEDYLEACDRIANDRYGLWSASSEHREFFELRLSQDYSPTDAIDELADTLGLQFS